MHIATMGSLAMGTNLGWSSPVQPQVSVNASSLDPSDQLLNLTPDEWSWVTSLLTLGAAVGCLVAGLAIEAIGRKATLLAASVPFTVGWILIIAASHPRTASQPVAIGGPAFWTQISSPKSTKDH